PAPGPPPPWLLKVRRELVGARLREVADTGPRSAELVFVRERGERTLVVELAPPGGLLLLGDGRRALAADGERARPPRPSPASGAIDRPSRLPALADGLELGRAVEELFSGKARAVRAAQLRRVRERPLRARVERLRRTREKVRAEADRGGLAEEHRRLGELLRRSGAEVGRAAREVTVTEYTADGARPVVVPLEPGLDVGAQAERHFRLYRRLSRGAARAAERLAELDRELGLAEAALAAARAEPDESLLAAAPEPAARRTREPSGRRPYRTFRAGSGERILVGRAGRDNDALTFAVARPDDLWLHARGIPGAHVLVPLPRGAEVSQETLLDAAHLALHHARTGRAERGEVSYTRAKYLRRPRGGAPGAVTYSREKTFLVRLEPDRLARLLATREEP
ncbi:MAG TPA: NFACT RNA binding domain-containing protein, partial [Myxococcaceae bacterium]|nr:NFACT RNA binding domain-containing protein [Myxococcaceae bacterium]